MREPVIGEGAICENLKKFVPRLAVRRAGKCGNVLVLEEFSKVVQGGAGDGLLDERHGCSALGLFCEDEELLELKSGIRDCRGRAGTQRKGTENVTATM